MKTKVSLFIISTFLFSCDSSTLGLKNKNDLIKYQGFEFNYFNTIPMSFGKDTIYPELWFRTLNVDGDNKRIIRYYTKTDTTTFTLPNAVNNYTTTACYSIEVNDKRYLWLEDNFGTTVFDIDTKRIKKVIIPKKQLTSIAPTGAPIGIRKTITEIDMKRQLGISRISKILILDSLNFKM